MKPVPTMPDPARRDAEIEARKARPKEKPKLKP